MLELRLPMERGFHRRRARWKRDERKKTDGEKKEERDEKKIASDLFVARRSVERKWRGIYGQATSD